jgi:phenylacetate-CoA ligase
MSKLLLPQGYRNAELLQHRLHTEPERLWIRRGEQRALRLFHAMAARVPAYKQFLNQHKINSSTIRTTEDLRRVPAINKDNYLRAFPREQLCWDGKFSHGQWVISTTSGSTGKPYYFPRETSQDWQYAVSAELYLRKNFQIHKQSTLYIVAFPMGAWIGGLFTYEALKIVAQHGDYDLSIITPGIHKQEVINAFMQLAPNFDQVIIGSYAPFLKDIISDGKRAGINWADHKVRFVFSAEAFSETFRDWVLRETGIGEPYNSTLNHYGTVDLGTMAHETPESILIRRTLINDNKLNILLPEATRQPTLSQYNPQLFYFEEENHNLLCTAFSGLPLVRYNLRDYGGVFSREHAHKTLQEHGYDVPGLLSKADISTETWNLPYVYVYERNDFSVSYYAFQLYPDTIRRALQQKPFQSQLTGKFTMLVDYDDEGRQHLNVNVELQHAVEPKNELAQNIQTALHDALISESSEYRETAGMIGSSVKPVVHLWPYEDQTYFRPGTKQKWVIK